MFIVLHYRPQGNVFTSVCNSVHGGGLVDIPWADTPSWADTPQADKPHPGQTSPLSRWLLQRMVRILLECILI